MLFSCPFKVSRYLYVCLAKVELEIWTCFILKLQQKYIASVTENWLKNIALPPIEKLELLYPRWLKTDLFFGNMQENPGLS